MKWIVVVLVLLNVAVYLIGLKGDPEAAQISSAGQYREVNVAAMSLIKAEAQAQPASTASGSEGVALEEDNLAQLKVTQQGKVLRAVEEKPEKTQKSSQSDKIIQPADVVNSASAKAGQKQSKPAPGVAPLELASVKTEQKTSAPQAAQADLACYRVGPFLDQNSLTAARRQLEKGQLQYRIDEGDVPRSIEAVRVYLGVDSSDAAIEAGRQRLKSMKVDHYVIRQNGTPMIQLGYFAEPARAAAYQKKLVDRGLDAKTETIYKEAAINSWLELEQASSGKIQSLKLPRGASAKKKACR